MGKMDHHREDSGEEGYEMWEHGNKAIACDRRRETKWPQNLERFFYFKFETECFEGLSEARRCK